MYDRAITCSECGSESNSRTEEGLLVCHDCGTVLKSGVEMTEVFVLACVWVLMWKE